ncbi:MAG: hypothetical protein ACKVT2_10295 [Saprospiraceae bacterium]
MKNILRTPILKITFVVLAIILLGKPVLHWLEWVFSGDKKEQLENLFSSINALVGALTLIGLIYTIFQQQKNIELQRDGLKSTVTANETIVIDSKVTALINLYLLFYDSNNFGVTRKKATTVFRGMIQYEDYFLFVFYRGVKAAKGFEPVSVEHQTKFQKVYKPNVEMKFEEFKKIDSEYRDKLDDLLHFFNLLSVRNMHEDFFKKVDFNYGKWRQYLWWYAFKVEAEFEKDEVLRKFCSLTTLSDSLSKLDILFGFKSPDNLKEVLEFAIIRDTLKMKDQQGVIEQPN